MQEKSTPRELGSIKLDTNLNGHIFIDQDDQDSLFGTRVVLTPSQAEEVCRYVRSVAGGEPPEELEELRAWKASAMVQLRKADALRELLPDYWGFDVYDATVDYIKKLVAGGEPEQWISVEERLPTPADTDRKGRVITLQGTENVQVGVRMPDYWWIYDGNHGYSSNCVTHWRALPAPPQGKE